MACTVGLTIAMVGPAAAQVSPDNRARAQQLFDSALHDAEAGNYAAACVKFLASQEADPKTSTLLNLANCYEKNGQTASAWGAFREAEGAARSAGRADWESRARARAAALEPKLVRLTLRVRTPSAEGLTLQRDGTKLTAGEWNLPIPVDPGTHAIVASAPGRVPYRASIVVSSENVELEIPALALVPPDKKAPADDAPAPGFWTPMRQVGLVVTGVGLLAAGTGGVLGLVAKQRYDDARSQCRDGTSSCPADAVRDSDGAYDLASVATVTGIAGLGVAAAGTAIIFLAPNAPRTTRVGFGPSSVLVTGSF